MTPPSEARDKALARLMFSPTPCPWCEQEQPNAMDCWAHGVLRHPRETALIQNDPTYHVEADAVLAVTYLKRVGRYPA